MSITILNPGMLTSVQDLGRIGYQQFGVSVSGVMDPRSASIANILVDNDEGEAVLECTMMGPHLRFDAPNIIAITGGDLGATLDGQSIDTYRAVPILPKAGQYIKFYAIDQAEFDRIAALEASSGYTVHTYPRKEAEQA